MVIECSSCHARFKLADDKIKPGGTKVRCTKCREVFSVFPEIPTDNTAEVSTGSSFSTPGRDENSSPPMAKPNLPPENEEPATPPPPEEDDWNQPIKSSDFSDDFYSDAGSSDLDAISFDNIEAPVFTVTTATNSTDEFDDDSAFSFSEESAASPASPSLEISFSDNNTESPLATAREEESIQENKSIDNEFTFAPAENLSDFSWDNLDTSEGETPGSTPSAPVERPQSPIQTEPQGVDFDFNSFSFDEPAPVNTQQETDGDESQTSSSIELSLDSSLSSPSAELDIPQVEEMKALPPKRPPESETYSESSEAPIRPLRYHPRKRKKGSSRPLFKIFLVIFILLSVGYAILNRQQLQQESKIFINKFIEKQVIVDQSGKIGLTNLSGAYLTSNMAGELFVIRGKAVNEFKNLRSSILIRGTIYGENGSVLQSQTSYCGNPLKDNDLKKLTINEIKNAMNNELGENLLNLNITVGKEIPCTIVFSKVPQKIKEFTVEVLESKPGSSK